MGLEGQFLDNLGLDSGVENIHKFLPSPNKDLDREEISTRTTVVANLLECNYKGMEVLNGHL